MNQATSIERLTVFTYAGKAYHLRPGPYAGRSLCLHRLMDTADADPIAQFCAYGDDAQSWAVWALNERGEARHIGSISQTGNGEWLYGEQGGIASAHRFMGGWGPTLPAVEALVQLSARLIEQGYARERA